MSTTTNSSTKVMRQPGSQIPIADKILSTLYKALFARSDQQT